MKKNLFKFGGKLLKNYFTCRSSWCILKLLRQIKYGRRSTISVVKLNMN